MSATAARQDGSVPPAVAGGSVSRGARRASDTDPPATAGGTDSFNKAEAAVYPQYQLAYKADAAGYSPYPAAYKDESVRFVVVRARARTSQALAPSAATRSHSS